MNNTTPPALPNPFTPMAFLPPELAYQLTVSTYVYVGTLGVLIWDILNNVWFDVHALFAYPLKLPAVVCFLSRSACLAFSLTTAIYSTSPVSIPCSTLCKVLDWIFAVAVSSTSLLFLIRLLAMFERNKPVRVFFCVMWLAVLAGVLTPTQGLKGDNIGPTKYCVNVKIEAYVGAGAIIPLVNDTLVFLAISWRLSKISCAAESRGGGMRAFFLGEYMPAFSRGLLRDGQVYYLTTVTTNLLTVVVFYSPPIPVVYRAMFGVPNVVLMNIMACRVYRRTKTGKYYRKESLNLGSNLGSCTNTNDNFIPLAFAGNMDRQLDLTMKKMHPGQGGAIGAVKTGEHDRLGNDEARACERCSTSNV